MSGILEAELRTYEAERERLLGADEGKFVLIHEDEVAGVFESQLDAINEGYRRYGNVPFLVRKITRFETPLPLISHL